MLKRWTQEELDILVANYQLIDNEALAELLPNRTTAAIQQKLSEMRLIRSAWSLPDRAVKDLAQPSDTDCAYLAGHFDGEGTISLRSNGKSFKIYMAVTNAHKPALEKYAKHFGGTVYPAGGTNKPLWRWSITGYHAALNVINALSPFSLEKREQLEVARAFILKRIEASVTHPTEDIRLLAKETAHRLTELKKL